MENSYYTVFFLLLNIDFDFIWSVIDQLQYVNHKNPINHKKKSI